MLGKKLINAGPVSSGANTFASENFNTVLYTGNGGTQRIGGYINKGAVFNGSSSYIRVDNSFLPTGNASRTFSFWTLLNTHSSDAYFMSYGDGATGQFFSPRVTPTSQGGYISFMGYAADLNSNVVMTTGEWMHLCYTYNGTTLKIYKNGVEIASGNLSLNTATTRDFIIGARDYNGSITKYIDGKLDQIRIFNKALSSSEVTTLYGETFASATISTTDIFDDDSGVALYQLDGNANDTGGASGKFGSGAIFNGSSSYITLGATNQFASSTVSISFWVNPATISTNYILLGNGNGGSFADGDNDIFLRSDGYIGYELGQSSSIYEAKYSTTTQLTANTWNHITLTYDSSLGTNITQVYVNGVQQSLSATYAAGGTFSGDIFIGTLNYHIGKRNLSTLFFDGRIDDVRIYSDVLTSTEVGYLYNNTTASIPTDNLVSYYKLDGDARDEQQLYDGTATNVTYTYDGTATNVTYQEATKFQPDLVWIKGRSGGTPLHNWLTDSVRGEHAIISSNLTNAQDTNTSYHVDSFDSNGFTLIGNSVATNGSGVNYVAWCFNAGGSTNTFNIDGTGYSTASAAGLDGGDINPTGASINTKSGFGIYQASPTTATQSISHGLNSPPEMYIFKTTSVTRNWYVSVNVGGTQKFGTLNGTGALSTTTAYTADANTMVIGGGGSVTEVAYAFHSVDGYSKIGSYTGNGSTSGPIVETGFEPAFLLIKRTDGANSWAILDNKRSFTNPRNKELYANLTDVESTFTAANFLTNGFQLINTANGYNANGGNYIYLAIAADPDTTTPTVDNSFDVVTWSGDASSSRKIETDFKPDLVWVKSRDNTRNHRILDSIRGTNKEIYPNLTNAEGTFAALSSFDSDGFTLSTSDVNYNGSNEDYVAWVWKAGDHDDNLPQINTEGTIDSTVSVNDAAGFSIVKYTSTSTTSTIGHGLSSAPELIILKSTTNTGDWQVYSSATGNTKKLLLNSTAAASTSGVWNNTSPTSTVFTSAFNNVGGVIAYCWTSVTGYQKIGSYTGTGANGNSVTTGFEPRWILIKNTTSGSASSWWMIDAVRSPSNPRNERLVADQNFSEVEYTPANLHFLSNGFELDGSYHGTNKLNDTYIYLAIK